MGSRAPSLPMVLVALVLVASVGVLAWDLGLLASGEYERATVTVVDEDGATLATVRVRVADTYEKRYTGLSDTASLGPNEGMLFVHESEGRHAYVMREMDFPIDIVFVAADGTITAIHHAPLPSETASEDLVRYRGEGLYVLELPYGYTSESGIEVGDRVVVPESV